LIWHDRSVDSAWSWVVVGGAFVVLFFSYGSLFSFGLFFPELEAAFSADRAGTSLVFSIVGALYPLLSILGGPAADRFGTRPVCLLGMIILGVGLTLAAGASALWQVYLGFGLGAAFGISFTFAPASAVVQRWLTHRRGLAAGLSSSGSGVSLLVLPFLVSAAIAWQGWRFGFLSLGLAAIVVGGAAALLTRDPPPVSRHPGSGSMGAGEVGIPMRQILLSRPFVMFFLSSLLCCLGLFLPFVHLVTYTMDQGLGQRVGVYLLGLIGIGSVVGRILLAALSDRIGRRRTLVATYAAMGLGYFVWLVGGGVGMLTLFALLFGVGYGGYVGMIAVVLADYFGTRRIGSVIGYFMPNVAIGGFLGPMLAGYAFDLWGSYDVAIAAAGITGLAAALFAALMPPPRLAGSAPRSE
jgi:MFS family permease